MGWRKFCLILLAFGLIVAGIPYLPSYVQGNPYFPGFIILFYGSFVWAVLKA